MRYSCLVRVWRLRNNALGPSARSRTRAIVAVVYSLRVCVSPRVLWLRVPRVHSSFSPPWPFPGMLSWCHSHALCCCWHRIASTGIKDKVLAAYRSGITTVLLPADNAPQADELPAEVKAAVWFVYVDSVAQVRSLHLRYKLPTRPRLPQCVFALNTHCWPKCEWDAHVQRPWCATSIALTLAVNPAQALEALFPLTSLSVQLAVGGASPRSGSNSSSTVDATRYRVPSVSATVTGQSWSGLGCGSEDRLELQDDWRLFPVSHVSSSDLRARL